MHDDGPRRALRMALAANRMDMKELSARLGKNDSYIQQYLNRGTPKELAVADAVAISQVAGIELKDLVSPETRVALGLDDHSTAAKTPSNLPEHNAILTQSPATIPAPSDMNTDLSVFGTVECGDGDYMEFTDTFQIKRPPVWAGRDDVYAVRASGESMTPRFFPGEIVLVDTKLKPRHGNDVIIQLHDGNGHSGIKRAMLKIYIKKSPTIYVFSSYNPDYEQNIEIPVEQVKSVDVVVPASELLGG